MTAEPETRTAADMVELPQARAASRSPAVQVCIIGLRGVPGIMGGVESHCQELFPRVKALRPDYRLTIIGRRPYLDASDNYRGVSVVPLMALRNKYLEAISNTIAAVLYARLKLRADVVHIHAIGPALVGPLARLLGMKLVVTHHGRDFDREKWNRFAKWVLRLGERSALLAADRVIVVSRSVTEDLQRRYPRLKDKIQHIPNGATDLSKAVAEVDEAEVLARFGLERGRYVIAVGRLVPEKAFHTLIAAYQKAAPDFKLVIAGKADHEDAYSRSILQHAGERICFTGFQGHGVLRVLYRNASLFVLPSTHEGLPIAALEAAGLGVPVLLSDIRPNLDIDLPAANYFPVGNVDALADMLNKDHARYAVEAADIARRFDWGAVAEATEQVYAGLAAPPRENGL